MPARAVAVAPDGRDAYVLAAGGAGRSTILHVDLAAGAVRSLTHLPGAAPDLALAGDRLYAPDPAGGRLWAVDRRAGTALRPVPLGRYPVAVAVAAG